jgi:transcriptional regulator with XRE-family HTH domain
MKYALEPIAAALKAAREAKGLSQRALSELAGVPQSHISKIERGAVDLRTSSLIELARILDLELVLVPRRSVPAVDSIVRSTIGTKSAVEPSSRAAHDQLKRLQKTLTTLERTAPTSPELAQIQRQLRDLQRMTVSSAHLETLRELTRNLRAIRRGEGTEDLRRVLSQLQQLRNRVVLDMESLPSEGGARPAYSLEEDEHED